MEEGGRREERRHSGVTFHSQAKDQNISACFRFQEFELPGQSLRTMNR